jgi:dihydrodipicolinate synthase/N-acetylneuraminate lyase
MLNRREFGLAAFGALAIGRSAEASRSRTPRSTEREALAERSAKPALDERPSKPMRGAFMILTTPFTASGEVDWEDLASEAAFVDRCGAHGIVWPQGSSGVANLTKAERMRGMEVLASAARGKAATLVLGVQGRDTAEMLEYAERAEALAPDAMIAMPPSAARGLDEYREYFRALARATARPIVVQTSGGARDLAPTVDLIVELAREFPHVAYVKEESPPLVERMRAELKHRPPLKGVFGASLGSGWLYEMRLGLDGVITGMAMYPDLMSRIWTLHEQGDAEAVRDAYGKFLLMRNLSQQVPGVDLYLLKKRGVFKTTAFRTGGAAAWKVNSIELSPDAVAEVEYRFAAVRPYLKVTS